MALMAGSDQLLSQPLRHGSLPQEKARISSPKLWPSDLPSQNCGTAAAACECSSPTTTSVSHFKPAPALEVNPG
jgi:hypothetical protein